MCQLKYVDEIGQENTWLNSKWQYLKRYRVCKQRARIVIPLVIRDLRYSQNAGRIPQPIQGQIQPGDMVRVRCKDEIQKTLDRSGRTGRCRFTLDMYNHCGKEYRIFKRVDHFYDEAKQRMCRCKDLFLLEGAYCSPSTCDRQCFFFWHASWLEKT